MKKKQDKQLLKRGETDQGQILDYQTYRFAYRSIARSTDSRTVISSVIPKNVVCGHSLNVGISNFENKYTIFISTLLNSFCFDFSLRQQVSANLTMFFIYQTPVPRLTEGDPYFKEIVERAAKLICTTPEFDDLAAEVGLIPPNPPSKGGNVQYGVTDEMERAKLRAELDGMIAHVYQLTETEFQHILNTFPIVPDAVKAAALSAYKQQ